jgi:hypothetical protein
MISRQNCRFAERPGNYGRRLRDARMGGEIDRLKTRPEPADRSPRPGHSLDSSHHWIPWRICSDFDNPVRADME